MTESASANAGPRLILASSSPRRAELLREAGYNPIIDAAGIDEEAYAQQLHPSDLARHLAFAKAEAICPKYPDDVVLAADTIVTLGERVLGKARDAAEAKKMLSLLAGSTHIVITGVAVMRRRASLVLSAKVLSAVKMRALSREEIDDYVAKELWVGKAGGYGIQDPDPFVSRLSGCHTNIVGLPMTTTKRLLAEAGIADPRS